MTRLESVLPLVLFALGLMGPVPDALASDRTSAQAGSQRVEVVEVDGVIDGPVEGAIDRTIRNAERNGAVVVLQIDSRGVLGADRTRRVVRRVVEARTPVVTWIGPAGAGARNGAAMLALAGHRRAMAPGTVLGPVRTLDLRRAGRADEAESLAGELGLGRDGGVAGVLRRMTVDGAEDAGAVDVRAAQLPDLLRRIDGETVTAGGELVRIRTAPARTETRFHKPDLWGRVLHATAQPSIVYLLLLIGLIGIVFELFHPDTGPAGLAGAVGLGFAAYGLWTLGASWLGVALIVGGIAAFCVDLRVEGLGLFTALGFAGLVAGSVILFPSPELRASPWILALGIASMVAFLLGAMTRVLRDLRAIARGELEVTEVHAHLEEQIEEGGDR